MVPGTNSNSLGKSAGRINRPGLILCSLSRRGRQGSIFTQQKNNGAARPRRKF